ncbi:unnamed protein product [Didymodactylos carnosus]|nr:unnamed protein product [Didymodactylos carnosus]CAF3712870.1 unnamed protein product [Didymodactylos carnosus]
MSIVIALLVFIILPYYLTGNVVVYTSNGYKLTIENKDDSFSNETRQHLIDTYFKVMPEMNAYFGQNKRDARLTIDPGYKGAAVTTGSNIVLSAEFIRKYPESYDAVTHEFAHVVQSYPKYDPSWLVEGIADFARYKWGVNNKKGGWSLPDFKSDQKYTDA